MNHIKNGRVPVLKMQGIKQGPKMNLYWISMPFSSAVWPWARQAATIFIKGRLSYISCWRWGLGQMMFWGPFTTNIQYFILQLNYKSDLKVQRGWEVRRVCTEFLFRKCSLFKPRKPPLGASRGWITKTSSILGFPGVERFMGTRGQESWARIPPWNSLHLKHQCLMQNAEQDPSLQQNLNPCFEENS